MLKWHTVDAVDDEHPSSRLRFEGVPFQDELPIPARGQGFQFPDFTIRDGRVVGCCYKGNKPFNTQLGENVQAPVRLFLVCAAPRTTLTRLHLASSSSRAHLCQRASTTSSARVGVSRASFTWSPPSFSKCSRAQSLRRGPSSAHSPCAANL